ncbi:MAG: M81 family metallopeptidase, partial [Planctomycetota bacterium]|nr:M81 family metallopeptidase [Planctomycetota bacterium]
IAIGSIFTECNHFCGIPLTLTDFERTEFRRGAEVLAQSAGTVGGMLHVLRERHCEAAPLLVASACPGGPIAASCYSQMKEELIQRLRAVLPVKGVLLALHGAATAENADDVEGDLLEAVRHLVGPAVPIVATLDLHAHVTEKMVHHADALLAWETYPHRDAFSTGERGARMLLNIVDCKYMPTMALAKVPVVVSAIHGGTEGNGPFADCMRFTKRFEGDDGVLSTGLFLVHPYLDLPDMGGGGLVITDNDAEKAAALAGEIAQLYWSRRADLEPLMHPPKSAIELGQKIAGGPVLLVETADCCGGGAAGDSVATLKALLVADIRERTLVPVVDPLASAVCHQAGVGSKVTFPLGHRVDPRWGSPAEVSGEVMRLTDGKFRYSGGIWDGQIGDMGPAAVLRIGAIEVMIASHATYDWNDEQFRSVGLDARQAKFVIVKNPMNFQMAYASIAKAAYILDTPGPTPVTLKHVQFRRLQRPYFPADKEIARLAPTIYQSVRTS